MDKNKDTNCLVSIICDVYNHERYLRDCLEGLVKQTTNFRYNILIHDDASIDGSPQIIKEYEMKFPEMFFPILQNSNQYSKGVGIWESYQFPRVFSKYVAFCEGDDYWIDSMKLQKEVDYLESHPDCSAVFTNIIVKDETSEPIQYHNSSMQSRFYTQKEMLKGLLFPLSSICVRSDVIKKWNYSIKANGDILLAYIATLEGKVFMIDDYMSVYRKTGKGVCTSKSSSAQLIAELSEWYNFHKQINFPHPQTLIYHQANVIFRFYCKNKLSNFPVKDAIKYIRMKYVPLYIYYLGIMSFNHFLSLLKLSKRFYC